MYKIKSSETRDIFMEFMQKNGHLKIPGASVVPVNDPSLLFINAGMAPLKNYFSGKSSPPQSDLCNVQPCIRTIDIEDIGDRHHLTFFEMLGSWSINGYYKEKAISLAFELLTEKMKLPSERLYATVYDGEENKGLPADEESAQIWKNIGIPNSRIIRLKEDNFWTGGETGPCGPCTEVFYDTRNPDVQSYEESGHFDDKNRYIEIWNAGVFMQYNRTADGVYEKLPFTSVDTGAGLERLVMALNNFQNIYDIDTLRPYIDYVNTELGAGQNKDKVASVRRIVDHIRSATMIMSDGVFPDKDGQSYIPRRLLRRSSAIALLNDKPNFNFIELSKMIINDMGNYYPGLNKNSENIQRAILNEIGLFTKSVKRGVIQFDKITSNSNILSGEQVFNLRATYGMPLDLISEISKERQITPDFESYKREFTKHQEVSRTSKVKS